MRIFNTRIIREKTYRELLAFKKEIEEILRKKLPVVADRTLKGKSITLNKGLVLVNSSISDSHIDYKADVRRNPIVAFYRVIIHSCVFMKSPRRKKKKK